MIEKNNTWYFNIYKGEKKPIPFTIKTGPRNNDFADITNYTFTLSGKVSLDTNQDEYKFTIGNSEFTKGENGLVYCFIPQATLLQMTTDFPYLCQLTMEHDGLIVKSQMFTITVLEAV